MAEKLTNKHSCDKPEGQQVACEHKKRQIVPYKSWQVPYIYIDGCNKSSNACSRDASIQRWCILSCHLRHCVLYNNCRLRSKKRGTQVYNHFVHFDGGHPSSPVHDNDVGGVASLCRSAVKVLHVVGLHALGAELLLTLCFALVALIAAVHHAANTCSVTNLELVDL